MLEEDDLDTLDARANLASACWNADLVDEALETEERILEESRRINGADHLDTLQARAALASSYRMTGRTQQGADLQEVVIAESERLLGHDHPATIAARKTRELNPAEPPQ